MYENIKNTCLTFCFNVLMNTSRSWPASYKASSDRNIFVVKVSTPSVPEPLRLADTISSKCDLSVTLMLFAGKLNHIGAKFLVSAKPNVPCEYIRSYTSIYMPNISHTRDNVVMILTYCHHIEAD